MSNNQITNIVSGIPPLSLVETVSDLAHKNGRADQVIAELSARLAVSDDAIRSFFLVLKKTQVPPEELKTKLIEIAISYNDLADYFFRVFPSRDTNPYVEAAKKAVLEGDFRSAEQSLVPGITDD